MKIKKIDYYDKKIHFFEILIDPVGIFVPLKSIPDHDCPGKID